MAEPASPTLEARRAQTFPILAPDEIARMRRFGTPCRYAAGARIYETGKPTPGMLVVLSGTIRITGRDGHGHDFPVVDHVAGAFSGELGQLSSRRSLVDAVAVGDVEALLISPEQLHALLIAEAALGEKVMRALILRRVALIETGTGGPVLIGAASLGDVARLGNFLRRNGIPHLLLDPASDLDAQAFIDRYAPRVEDLPLVVCPDGSVLRNPTESTLAKCIGMLDAASGADRVYDVAVAGAGPAGLATAARSAPSSRPWKAVASGTGPRPSRRRCAPARRWCSWAAATPRDRPPCFSPATPRKSGCWCAAPASPRACRSI